MGIGRSHRPTLHRRQYPDDGQREGPGLAHRGQARGAQNAFFGVLELAPGAKVPVHRDATEEYIYILSGTGQMTIDGVTRTVGPGAGVFMPANAEVSFVAGEERVRAVQFFAGQGPEAKYDGWVEPGAKAAD